MAIIMLVFISACSVPRDPAMSADDTSSLHEIKNIEGKYILRDGQSDYKIVVPENASEQIALACDELQSFFFEATDIVLPVYNDNEISEKDFSGKIISIDRTRAFNSSGIKADFACLGYDGFIIKRKDDAIFLCGGDETGSAYAVYDFLGTEFGLEIYSPDCYTINKVSESALKDYDVMKIPDIPSRIIGRYETWYTSLKARTRMRVINAEERISHLGHSFLYFMPLAKYYYEHPEWYSGDVSSSTGDWELCLSNDAVRKTFVNNVIEYIEEHPKMDIISICQNDGGVVLDAELFLPALWRDSALHRTSVDRGRRGHQGRVQRAVFRGRGDDRQQPDFPQARARPRRWLAPRNAVAHEGRQRLFLEPVHSEPPRSAHAVSDTAVAARYYISLL